MQVVRGINCRPCLTHPDKHILKRQLISTDPLSTNISAFNRPNPFRTQTIWQTLGSVLMSTENKKTTFIVYQTICTHRRLYK